MTSKRSTLDLGPKIALVWDQDPQLWGSGGDRKGGRPDIESWDAANPFAGTAAVESTRVSGGG
jgi:hypothetical protein